MSVQESLPPHPPLRAYYGEASKRREFVGNIFDDTAGWYDSIISMLSFGSGNAYRHRALVRNGLRDGMSVLDVATGTGVVARAAKRITARVVGIDPSIGMLISGRSKHDVPLMRAMGEELPVESESIDFLTVGFALRHLADLRVAFSEWRRVLKPGGRILILEITCPQSPVAYRFLRFYLGRVIPLLTRIRTRSADAEKLMHYYWDTIDQCVPPQQILDALADVGFHSASRYVDVGVFSEYSATK